MDTLRYAIYDNTTGMILSILEVLADDTVTIPGNTGVGQTAVQDDTVDDDLHYYVAGVRTNRPLLSTANSWSATTVVANGINTITFGSSLPNPTTANVSSITGDAGLSGTVTDGTFEFSTNIAGSYFVDLEAFPYQIYKIQVEAT